MTLGNYNRRDMNNARFEGIILGIIITTIIITGIFFITGPILGPQGPVEDQVSYRLTVTATNPDAIRLRYEHNGWFIGWEDLPFTRLYSQDDAESITWTLHLYEEVHANGTFTSVSSRDHGITMASLEANNNTAQIQLVQNIVYIMLEKGLQDPFGNWYEGTDLAIPDFTEGGGWYEEPGDEPP